MQKLKRNLYFLFCRPFQTLNQWFWVRDSKQNYSRRYVFAWWARCLHAEPFIGCAQRLGNLIFILKNLIDFDQEKQRRVSIQFIKQQCRAVFDSKNWLSSNLPFSYIAFHNHIDNSYTSLFQFIILGARSLLPEQDLAKISKRGRSN